MSGGKQSHECEVAAALDLSDLASVAVKVQITTLDFVERLLARPLKSLSPGFVTEPVADVIGVTLWGELSAVYSSQELRMDGDLLRR